MSWPLVSLSSIAEVVTGNTPSKADESFFGGNIPFVSPSELDLGYVSSSKQTLTAKGASVSRLIPADSVMVCCIGSLGKVGISSIPVVTNQQINSLVVNQEVAYPLYVYYFCKTLKNTLNDMAPKTTVAIVNKTKFSALKIPLPPLETQKKIVAVLEKADQLRKDCQQMEQELNSLAQSVFIDMFGDPVTNPKRWDAIPCKTLCEKITVGVVVQPASYYVDNGVPALRSLNVRENKLSEDKMMYFSKEAHTKQLAKSQIFEGDVLIVRSGQPGRAAVVTKKFDNCNCIDVLIARPNASVLESQYLSFFLNSEGGRKLVLKEERGQVQKHLNVKVLNEALIPCPPIEKQRQFIDVYNILLDEFNNTWLLIGCQNGLFNALMQKAFNGELDL